MDKNTRARWIVGMAVFVLAASLSCVAQDVGFEVISEGVVDEEPGGGGAFGAALYGKAGYSAAGTFWTSAGIRAELTLAALEIYGDAAAGAAGLSVTAGVTTTMFGFGTAAEVVYAGGAPTINLRGWGEIAEIGLSANASLAGGAASGLISATKAMSGFGLSASLGVGGGTLTTASLGASTEAGGLSLSVSGGWAAGQFAIGGGAGLRFGPVNLTANAGYNGGLGLNAVLGGELSTDAFQATTVAMLDNTGVGFEASGELALGSATVSALARLGGGDLGLEVGGSIPVGGLVVSLSVAFDTQAGFSWAEVGLELPLF
jgi:hypothetical protein